MYECECVCVCGAVCRYLDSRRDSILSGALPVLPREEHMRDKVRRRNSAILTRCVWHGVPERGVQPSATEWTAEARFPALCSSANPIITGWHIKDDPRPFLTKASLTKEENNCENKGSLKPTVNYTVTVFIEAQASVVMSFRIWLITEFTATLTDLNVLKTHF